LATTITLTCQRRHGPEKLSTQTQTAYIRGVNKFYEYLEHTAEKTNLEELREFQLFMANLGISGITVNATLTAVKFLFQITLDKPEIVVGFLL